MEPILIVCLIIAFAATFYTIPSWIKRAKSEGLIGKDVNKKDLNEVAEAGGITAILGFVLGILVYIAINTFYFKSAENTIEIFSLLTTILLLSFIGMIDDVLGWKIGLGKRIRIALVLFAAIPLMVIASGNSSSLAYLLLVIPIGVAGCSITFNFLAGMNGLEARQGILLVSALSIASYFSGNTWIAFIGLIMIISLLAFLYYNKFPAKIFPGDILTYSVGGLIAIMAILAGLEKFALFIFIPYFIEIVLKLKGKLKKQSFGKPNKEGSLDLLYPRIYSLNHLSIVLLKKMNIKSTERAVVNMINIIQIIFIIIGFILFRSSIFA
jgi:UDP-N-acetylglucosamine--dolichyl-phosphate N-acetylglucosaminephosphotransferase